MQNPFEKYNPVENDRNCGMFLKQLDRIAVEIERLNTASPLHYDILPTYFTCFSDFVETLNDLRLCLNYSSNPPHYFQFFEVHVRYIRSQIINVSEFITQRLAPTTEKQLEENEQFYLTLTSLFKKIRDKKSVAITLSRIVVMYTQLMLTDIRYKSAKNINKIYDFVRKVIELSMPENPPSSMDITYVFLAYAQLIQRENPVDALEIFEHANRYAEQGFCKHPLTHYFCLIELASIYYQACDNRNKYFKRGNGEISDTSVSLLLQGINFALKAVALIRINRLDISNEHCHVLLADLYYELGIQAENKYSSAPFGSRENTSDLEGKIIEWYTQSIHWAHQSRQRNLELKGVNQLAWFLYRHTQSRRAIELCQNAISEYIAEAEARRDFPLAINKYKQQYEAYIPTNKNSAKDHLIFYTNLLKDLIKLEENRTRIDATAKRFKDDSDRGARSDISVKDEELSDLKRKNPDARTAPSYVGRR